MEERRIHCVMNKKVGGGWRPDTGIDERREGYECTIYSEHI